MLSINGKLKSVSKLSESNNYQGHYIEVSYDTYLLFKDKRDLTVQRSEDTFSVAKSVNNNDLSFTEDIKLADRFRLREELAIEKLTDGLKINEDKDEIKELVEDKNPEWRKDQEGIATKNITKRITVSDNGDFVFNLEGSAKDLSPKFLIRVFAPDGEELHRDDYSLNSLFPEHDSTKKVDDSKPFFNFCRS